MQAQKLKYIMSKEKEIVAGYLWPKDRENPGDPIYPHYWKEEDEWKNEMEKYPPEEVLDIESGSYRMEVTYPLSKPYNKEVHISKEGITRQELMDVAADAYHKIYYFVNEGVYADGIDEHSEVWNKYGIWGHGMEDLTIHTFYVDEESKVITLGVDS